jgi:hypothetical protein
MKSELQTTRQKIQRMKTVKVSTGFGNLTSIYSRRLAMENDVMVLRKYGLKVVLNRNEVFPEDPGNGTPAMIYDACDERYSATLWCAMGEDELTCEAPGHEGSRQLRLRQIEWLNEVETIADTFLYGDRDAN